LRSICEVQVDSPKATNEARCRGAPLNPGNAKDEELSDIPHEFSKEIN